MTSAKPWLFVLGTRPEAIKLAPLVREFARRQIPHEIVFTGQHATLAAGTGFLAEFPNTICLNLPSNNDPLAYADAVVEALDALESNVRAETDTQGRSA